jgi:hypothetical protein
VKLGLPVLPVHREGIVAADTAPRSDGQGVAQARLVEVHTLRVVCASEVLEWRLAHERTVRSDVVALVDPGEQAGVEIVQ